jgi:hypothetical protein
LLDVSVQVELVRSQIWRTVLWGCGMLAATCLMLFLSERIDDRGGKLLMRVFVVIMLLCTGFAFALALWGYSAILKY